VQYKQNVLKHVTSTCSWVTNGKTLRNIKLSRHHHHYITTTSSSIKSVCMRDLGWVHVDAVLSQHLSVLQVHQLHFRRCVSTEHTHHTYQPHSASYPPWTTHTPATLSLLLSMNNTHSSHTQPPTLSERHTSYTSATLSLLPSMNNTHHTRRHSASYPLWTKHIVHTSHTQPPTLSEQHTSYTPATLSLLPSLASTASLSVLQALPDAQPTVSKHWRLYVYYTVNYDRNTKYCFALS